MILKTLGIIVALLILALVVVWLAIRGPDIPYATLEAKYANGSSHFADLPGGYHVHYRDDGDPKAPLLVLLHGYGDSFTSWEGWVAALRPNYRLISIDFPGHGLTRAPEGTVLDAAVLADFVDSFATELKLPTFAVAGNSMGGGVAWQLAVRHPERINALILVDAAGFPNEKPPGKVPLAFKILRYSAGRWLLAHIDNRSLIREGLKTDVYDKSLITDFVVDRWAEFQRAPGHRAILMSLNFSSDAKVTRKLLSGINVPTLILWGEADPLIEPAAAYKFKEAIPAASVTTYKNVGHLPQIELPQRSAANVATFLDGIGR